MNTPNPTSITDSSGSSSEESDDTGVAMNCKPRPKDVVLGRGKKYRTHPGNVLYTGMCAPTAAISPCLCLLAMAHTLCAGRIDLTSIPTSKMPEQNWSKAAAIATSLPLLPWRRGASLKLLLIKYWNKAGFCNGTKGTRCGCQFPGIER